jgi:hypothetical protein
MRRAVCTYCAGPKRDDGCLLPAVDRYRSRRIRTLALRAASELRPFLILSGEYGLLRGDEPIPWYDHLLLMDEVAALVPRVAAQLTALGIGAVEYHTAPLHAEAAVRPYFETITAACALAGAALTIEPLPAGLD